jgi:predicted TIM-barrel fold metal-dependent hydrolase
MSERPRYRILDADRHVMEPVDLWKERLPPELRSFAPYLVPAELSGTMDERVRRFGPKGLFPLRPTLTFQGRSVWQEMSEHAQVELSWSSMERRAEVAAAQRPEGQLATLDRFGIEAAFLYPTLALYLVGIDDLPPGLGAAFAAAYNDWLHQYCSLDPARLRGVGLVSTHDPGLMAAEVERAAGFGWKAVMVLPNAVAGRGLSDEAYEPFWAACERRNVAVAVHGATHTRLPAAGAGRFKSHFGLHACAHPMEMMIALLSLIEGGVLERHPGLRVAFLESGCGWLPYWLYRLDRIEYAHYAGEVRDTVKREPSEYFRRQCFIVIEPDEPYLPALVEHIGADNLLFGTDFPHGDHGDDMVDQAVGLAKKLPEEVVRKILCDNPSRFYGLGAPAPRETPAAERGPGETGTEHQES